MLSQDFFSFSARGSWSHCLEEWRGSRDQEWWAAKSGLWRAQSSQRGGGPARVATRVSKSKGFYGLAGGLFNLINPPGACHPIRFLSSTCHVGKGGGLLPAWCKTLLRVVSSWWGFLCPWLPFFQLPFISVLDMDAFKLIACWLVDNVFKSWR